MEVGFDSDRATYEANDPLSIMAAAPAGRYAGVEGIVSVGRDDEEYASVAPVLADAATQAGSCCSSSSRG